MRLAAIIAFAALAFPVIVRADTLLVGPAGRPLALADAVAQAQDGDVIDLLPGNYRAEGAVISGKRLTLRGVGERPVFIADGRLAEGRGIWVVRGGDVTVENVEFRGARGTDADGAGIRLEGGHLVVRRCVFADNDSGILTGNQPDAELDIADSIFTQAPRVVGGLHHLLYVGRIGKLTITGSRFQQGFEGHLIKSRARETHIAYNLIDDGPAGGASYEIDLPSGGLAWIIGNVIEQSAATQNPVVIAYGSEESRWPKNALYLAHNTLVNDAWLPAWFLRVWRDRLPDSTQVYAVNNLTIGWGLFNWGAAGEFDGNWRGLASMLVDPTTLDFELRPGAWLRGRGVDPRKFGGQDLSPTAEFRMPVGTRKLPPLTRWTPGAFQR
jgi:hypothetical protein